MTDDELAEQLAGRELEGRGVLALVDRWLATRGPLASWGALSEAERTSAARVVHALRAQLRRIVAAERLESAPLAVPHVVAAIYIWDKIFVNPLSVANVSARAEPDDATDPVLRALAEPFPPHVPDAGAVVRAQPTPLRKLLAALWLLNVPAHAVSPADRERFVAHATSICAAVPAPAMPMAAALGHALSTNAFRAAYGGGNTAPALAAIGRLLTEAIQRQCPRFAQPIAPHGKRDRIRIGYVSAHFRRHAVTSYMANRVLCRDRSRFHVTLFAVGGHADEVTAELAASADTYQRLEPHPIDDVASAIVGAELDVLVHVDIGMDFPTHLLAGLHLAPRQIALMGHATTTGMPVISHYLSGDHEPPDAARHYTEQLVVLPALGAAQRPSAEAHRRWTRAELGIPDDAVVLANFGHALKHGHARDVLYAEILDRAPRAHLLLKPFFSRADHDPDLAARLVALGRVTLVPPVPRPGDVTTLYELADVQLDTFPFGGWTTNLDALRAGLPIVTQAGETGRERWGVRMLELLGVEIGAAHDDREFVEAAVQLATDDALRRRIAAQIRGSSGQLFDGPAAQPAYERALLDIIQVGEGSGDSPRITRA